MCGPRLTRCLPQCLCSLWTFPWLIRQACTWCESPPQNMTPNSMAQDFKLQIVFCITRRQIRWHNINKLQRVAAPVKHALQEWRAQQPGQLARRPSHSDGVPPMLATASAARRDCSQPPPPPLHARLLQGSQQRLDSPMQHSASAEGSCKVLCFSQYIVKLSPAAVGRSWHCTLACPAP